MTPFGIRIYSFSWIASSICAQCMRSWRLRSSMQCSSHVCVCVLVLAFLFWPDSLLLYGWYRIGSECFLLSWCVRVVSLCHMHWHHDIIQHLGCRCNSQQSTTQCIQMRLHTSTLKMFRGIFFNSHQFFGFFVLNISFVT